MTTNNELKTAILASEANDELEVISESDSDILTDDYMELREINYHLIPPTAEWLKERFFFAPSVSDCSGEYVSRLLRIDPNMFTCLNRIIFLHETEEDEEAVLRALDIADLDMPDYHGFLGLKWSYMNSVIINMTVIENESRKLVEEDKTLDFDAEVDWGVRVTLLHELRHLGLEANPFLDEDEYPKELFSESAVEEWAIEKAERLW